MASASWYKETDEKINYTKLSRLLVDGGTQALCSVFDGKYSPSSLKDFLNDNKETLQKLKKPEGKVLNNEQWEKLYPTNGSDPQSKDFDITLLFVLLRNICGLTPPATAWDVLPHATDNSLEANLARIKYYRNNAIAHKSNTEINDADFKQHWQDISSALQSLGLSQDDIDYLKSSPLGEKDYNQLLYDWYISDKDVKTQLEDLKSDTTDLKSDTTDLKSDTTDIKSDTTDIKSDLQFLIKHFRSGSSVSTSARSRAELFEKQPSIEASLVIQKVETVVLESAPPGPSGLCSSETEDRPSKRTSASEAVSCKELEICFKDLSLATIDTNEAAFKVADLLNLDKSSMDNPSEDIVVRCRKFCSYLKSNERDDIVKKMRDLLPSGLTGPLTNEKVLVGDMIGKLEDLTRSLCGNDLWKTMADHLGIRRCHFGFHGNKENPAESILEDVCRKRRLTIGDLYDVLCKCDANALADEFL